MFFFGNEEGAAEAVDLQLYQWRTGGARALVVVVVGWSGGSRVSGAADSTTGAGRERRSRRSGHAHGHGDCMVNNYCEFCKDFSSDGSRSDRFFGKRHNHTFYFGTRPSFRRPAVNKACVDNRSSIIVYYYSYIYKREPTKIWGRTGENHGVGNARSKNAQPR